MCREWLFYSPLVFSNESHLEGGTIWWSPKELLGKRHPQAPGSGRKTVPFSQDLCLTMLLPVWRGCYTYHRVQHPKRIISSNSPNSPRHQGFYPLFYRQKSSCMWLT